MDPTPRRVGPRRTDALHDWYESHAESFRGAATIERAFLELPPVAQHRLNDFKLSFLQPGGIVDLRGRRVLELGCGHGRLPIEVPTFAEYVGVDFCEGLVRLGRERLREAGLAERARLVVADALAYDDEPGAYDVVCALGMFEFVAEPERVLARMARFLRPGGTLFFDVHLASPLYDRLRHWRWERAERRGAVPKRTFAARALRHALADLDLDHVEVLATEYPLLGGLYARTGARVWLRCRDALAAHPWANPLATDAVAIARSPPMPFRARPS